MAIAGGPAFAGVLDPAGPVGRGDRTILLDSVAIMLCVVVPVIILTLAFAWWFRAGNTRAKHLPDWEFSGRIEIVVWSIPAMIVLFLGGLAWIGSHQLDPHQALKSSQKPVRIEVVSMDWKWLFIYPDLGIASVNQVTIPVGAPVEFSLTSADVMNSFFIPRLGSQIYTMAGMVTHVNLEADEAGAFPGLSAHFSGDGFSHMRFTANAVPQADFNAFVSDARASNKVLDQAEYDRLAKPSIADAVVTYHGAMPELFKHILDESAPGTMTGAMQDPAEIPASSPPAAEKE
jgi:cytochrome o ubiquinol oxidase subunit 2